ncbi:heat shock protein transcriptional repressor HspR [Zhihengliuella flava]|uniref:MerR family transcriptional regulator/heat shock protein HspR n=1 Tax=Zhihengliuella flava TaxID=1285193 RepID=A0A931DC85_9MICC|nr:helix-turn-helix transcriptional regulator [Zhihengliuella flava]MBG6084203.1 MerR family transcriptional regulator/heat shock protein HspR [Zhihengliuella flava]
MNDEFSPVFVISVAAELADMHPQTLRQYDRMGLVTPQRQTGKQRRYSRRDVEALREIQRLSKDGVSLEGIRRILELERQVQSLQARVAELREDVEVARMAARGHPDLSRVFAAGAAGDVVTLARGQRPRARSQALMVWRPTRALGR